MPKLARGLLAGTLLTVLAGFLFASQAPANAMSGAASAVASTLVVRQLITVTATSHSTSYATFRAYQVTGTTKVLVAGPWTARVGYNGIAAPGQKREGDGRTPSGTYGFSFFFGVSANPGVAFPFRRAYTYDYWDDDPLSQHYNTWVDARFYATGRNPEPLYNIPAYDYAAVIAYNTARTPGLGSAIFLHVSTGTATAGCVSLPTSELLKILLWLRPADDPTISISAL